MLTILVLRVPFLIFFKKGACVFCKDNAVFVSKHIAVSISKHIVQQKFNKIEQATQMIENFLQKKKVHLDSKGQKVSKTIGASPKAVSESPRYSHPTAGRQVNDYLRLQSALRIYAERWKPKMWSFWDGRGGGWTGPAI